MMYGNWDNFPVEIAKWFLFTAMILVAFDLCILFAARALTADEQ